MTGIDIIGGLLLGYTPLTNKVPAAQIKAGALADDAPLPSILVRTVSVVERAKLVRGDSVRQNERVSATVRAGSYRDQKQIIGLIAAACAGKTGAIGGAKGVSVEHAGAGPDARGVNLSFEQAIDFRVSFETPTT